MKVVKLWDLRNLDKNPDLKKQFNFFMSKKYKELGDVEASKYFNENPEFRNLLKTIRKWTLDVSEALMFLEREDNINYNNPPSYIVDYEKTRSNKTQPKMTAHGTFVSDRDYEEHFWISRIDRQRKYISSISNIPTWFLLTVWPLKWESGGNWINLEEHWSSVLCVNIDLDAWNTYSSKLPGGWFWSYSHIKFCELAESLAKGFCEKNGYSLERVILGFPQTRRLVYKTEGWKLFFPKQEKKESHWDQIKDIQTVRKNNNFGEVYGIK